MYIKNTKTGEVYTRAGNYHAYCEGANENRKIIKEKIYYPYTFPSKVAAYVLPDDFQTNERVILEDLIEDIIGACHAWGNYRLESAEAIWNGERFIVDYDSYDVEVTMG